MSLARTPAEKILLTRVCQRASLTAGVCSDTNNELAQATAMHLKTVSDLIGRLVEAGLVVTTVDKEQANKRNLMPRPDMLADYPSNTDSLSTSYPSITDSPTLDNASNVYSPVLAGDPPVVDQVRRCVVTGVDITHQGIHYPFMTAKTLKSLLKFDRPAFARIVARLGLPDESGEALSTQWQGVLSRVQQLASTHAPAYPIVCAEEASATAPVPVGARRFCPITNIDITHQQSRHAFATAWTIEALYKSNRPAFDQLAATLLPESLRQGSQSDPCFALSGQIRRLAKRYRRDAPGATY